MSLESITSAEGPHTGGHTASHSHYKKCPEQADRSTGTKCRLVEDTVSLSSYGVKDALDRAMMLAALRISNGPRSGSAQSACLVRAWHWVPSPAPTNKHIFQEVLLRCGLYGTRIVGQQSWHPWLWTAISTLGKKEGEGPSVPRCLFSAQMYPWQDCHTDRLHTCYRLQPSPLTKAKAQCWRGGLSPPKHGRQGGRRERICPDSQTVKKLDTMQC